MLLSPLYPILDAGYLYPLDSSQRREYLHNVAQALAAAGVTIVQYRNKQDGDAQVLRDAIWLRRQAPSTLSIILNDRVHLVEPSGCDGAHIGQTDPSPEAARTLLGPHRILGLSTHTEAQLRAADLTTADYLAIGPVYATGSKPDADAVVGLEGVRHARALTRKPLVAIGGITLARAAEVRAAGADSLAVISALFSADAGPLENLAEDFLKVFR